MPFRYWDMSRRSGLSYLTPAFRAYRGAATASEKFACIFRRPYDARFARLVAPLVWGALPGRPGSLGCLEWSPLLRDTPKGFPLAGQEAPGKSQMLGFFSRVPDALAASGSYQTTDEGTLSMVSRAGKPTLRQSLRLFSLRSKCRLPLHKGGMVGCARLPCVKGAVGESRLRDRLLGTKSSGSHEVTSLFYFEASIDAAIDSSTSISTSPKTR